MKKMTLSVLLILININSFSQQPKIKTDPIEKIHQIQKQHNQIRQEISLVLLNWALYIDGNSKFGVSNTDAQEYFDNYIIGKNTLLNPQMKLLQDNRAELDSLLFEMDTFGDCVFSYNSIPLQVIQTDTGLILSLFGLMSSNVFNTLQTTARERAEKMVVSELLERLIKINNIVKSPQFVYLGAGVAFGSRDFTKTLNDIRGEYVYIVSNRLHISEYEAGIITEEELVDHSAIFLIDRDNGTFRKIKITLK